MLYCDWRQQLLRTCVGEVSLLICSNVLCRQVKINPMVSVDDRVGNLRKVYTQLYAKMVVQNVFGME